MTEPPTPLQLALERIGDRWSLLIIDALQGGPLRFSDLTEQVRGIAPNTLSSRLTRLETDGVIVADAYSERPVRYEYQLTAAGRDLAGALRLLAHWGVRLADESAVIRHDLCGTPLEPRWYCASCERVVAETDAGAEIRMV
ncbi:MAG: transcriptional regulator [Actinobacteria bacterium]|nr:MAG: transcriptional regulator [Actinomycetota bacterium]